MQYQFKAQLKNFDDKGVYIEFPYDVETCFNKKGRIKVKCTFDGIEYRGSLVNMGLDCHIVGVVKAIYTQLNKQVGDEIEVILEEDIEPRIVEVPLDLQARLNEFSQALDFFNTLSYTNQKTYVTYLESAKKEETRLKRLDMIIDKLLAKEKRV